MEKKWHQTQSQETNFGNKVAVKWKQKGCKRNFQKKAKVENKTCKYRILKSMRVNEHADFPQPLSRHSMQINRYLVGVEGFLWWGRVWDPLWLGDSARGRSFWVGLVANSLELEDILESLISSLRLEFEFKESRRWNDCSLELLDNCDGCSSGEYRFSFEPENMLANSVRKNSMLSVSIEAFMSICCLWYTYSEESEDVLHRLWWEPFMLQRGTDFCPIRASFWRCCTFCVALQAAFRVFNDVYLQLVCSVVTPLPKAINTKYTSPCAHRIHSSTEFEGQHLS